MSSENDGGVSFAIPGEVDDWLAREADRRDEEPDDVCRRLVTAAHAVASDDLESTADVPASVLEDVRSLQSQLDAQREEFRDLLEDVRDRVVQVKRETDAKAPADHDHAAHPSDDDLENLRADLESLRTDLATLESTVDTGFENVEDVLEHLLEDAAALEDRSTLLANAVVDLRERRTADAERERRRAEADRLKRAANRLGIRSAVCDSCDEPVDIALLTASECPHCASGITAVVEKSSLFGSHTLETGEPPALEGRVETPVEAPSDDPFGAIEPEGSIR